MASNTYRSVIVGVVDIQLLHCLDDRHQALDGVAVDNWFVGQTLILCVALFMNDPVNHTIGSLRCTMVYACFMFCS